MAQNVLRPWVAQLFKSVHAVVCDLEGTLVDLEVLQFLSFELAMGFSGVKITVDEIRSLPGAVGGGNEHIANLLASQYGLDAQKLLRYKYLRLEELLAEYPVSPRPGVVEAVELITGMKRPLAIGSLTERSRGNLILQRSGLAGYFPEERCVFKEHVDPGRVKPKPDVYLHAAQLLGVAVEDILVIEDSPAGVEAAVAAGAAGIIAVPSPFFQRDHHCHQMLRAAGATHIIDHWDELFLLGGSS